MYDTVSDMDLIRRAVREAGVLALENWTPEQATTDRVWNKEPNHPVTETDLAVNALLEDRLRSARPDYGWLSEETADNDDRLGRDRIFVVDPIDGTRAFMKGDPHFCICVAVLEDGEPISAAVYNPAFDEFYEAEKAKGARRNGTPIAVSDQPVVQSSRMIGEPRMFAHPAWPTPWPDLQLANPKPNSTAYRMALVADGRYDGVIVLWQKGDWDVAASSLIVREAGGQCTTHQGAAYTFNRPAAAQQSLVAAGPYLHPLLIDRCKHVELPDPHATTRTRKDPRP